MTVSKIAGKLREKIKDFSGELSKDLCKVSRRFVQEMVYGIQTRGSVRLSEIARSLNEKIPIKKTIDRLSRQLSSKGLGGHLGKKIIQEGVSRIHKDTLLILDMSDVSKRYAEKMEYLARVRDGSDGKLAHGYWLTCVVGAEHGENTITPLYQHLYSQDAPEFESENSEILKSVDEISTRTHKRGIWVVDRGGDRKKLIVPFLERQLRFIIRLVGNRHLLYRGKARLATELANGCPLPYADTILTEDKGKEKRYRVEYGYRKVKLPGRKEQLYLLVIKGFGIEPIMLLTTETLRKRRSVLWNVIESYLTRWRIEETIRFIKQSYNLEDIRLLRYVRLQNMMSLVLAASFFAAVYLGVQTKLKILAHTVMKAAKRIFGIPDFRYYAIADGIREILNRSNKGPLTNSGIPPPDNVQLVFDF